VFSVSGYKHYVAKWFNVLMPKMEPFLYGNGGNIIMVQVKKNPAHHTVSFINHFGFVGRK